MSDQSLGPLNQAEVMMRLFEGIDQTIKSLSYLDSARTYYDSFIASKKPDYVPSLDELSDLSDNSVMVCNEIIKNVGGIAICLGYEGDVELRAKVLGIAGFRDGQFIYVCQPTNSNDLFKYPVDTAQLEQMHYAASFID